MNENELTLRYWLFSNSIFDVRVQRAYGNFWNIRIRGTFAMRTTTKVDEIYILMLAEKFRMQFYSREESERKGES